MYTNGKLTGLAKVFRRNMTKEEKHLWYDFLRGYSVHIYRQRPIGNYVADFYCDFAKLVIEIDGSQHNTYFQIQHDNKRTDYLNSVGIEVIRFTDEMINTNFHWVCEMIDEKIQERANITPPLRRFSAGTSPQGEAGTDDGSQ